MTTFFSQGDALRYNKSEYRSVTNAGSPSTHSQPRNPNAMFLLNPSMWTPLLGRHKSNCCFHKTKSDKMLQVPHHSLKER